MIDTPAFLLLTATQLISMSVFAFTTSASPGPVNIVLVMSGAKFGINKNIPYIAGATLGFNLVLLIVGVGFGVTLIGHPLIKNLLVIGGTVYMSMLAYRIAKADISEDLKGGVSKVPGIIAGILAQFTNPKAWIVSISAISIYINSSENFALTLVILSLIFFVICFLSLLAWSAMGAMARKHIRNMQLFNITMAVLLLASLVVMLVDIVKETVIVLPIV